MVVQIKLLVVVFGVDVFVVAHALRGYYGQRYIEM